MTGHSLCPPDQGKLDPLGLRRIELDQPQLFADDYLIESRFDTRALAASVPHVLHLPERSSEPLLRGDNPWEPRGISQASVLYDAATGRYRMYYTSTHRDTMGKPGYPPGTYFLCYAESEDGIHWEKPDLGFHPWGAEQRTNILLQGEREAKIANVHVDNADYPSSVANIGVLPRQAFRGHHFLMYYGDGSHYLATSEDGVHWQPRVHRVIANRIDCYQTLLHDETRDEYVSFLRNKLIFGEPSKSPPGLGGNTRMISRVASSELWSAWDTMPVSVLIPDQGDAQRFYGMPTFRYGGLYWGMLQQFDENPQTLQIELVFSRDGIHWQRLPHRPLWLPVGAPGSWDSGMVITGDRLIERDDEWWLYYSAWNGYHDDDEVRQSGIGLARLRKEGFLSVRAGDLESYLLTRPFHWPGGRLSVNADASSGSVEVRVTDLRRSQVAGFSSADGIPLRADSVRHQVAWKEADIASLKGQLIRLEFKFTRADLFAFIACE